MLQNLPISISQIFCLLCSCLCFPNMIMLIIMLKAINFNAAAQPDYLALPYHACNQSCDVLKLKVYLKNYFQYSLDGVT